VGFYYVLNVINVPVTVTVNAQLCWSVTARPTLRTTATDLYITIGVKPLKLPFDDWYLSLQTACKRVAVGMGRHQ